MSRSATKWKSWCSTSTRTDAASRSASSSVEPTPGDEFASTHGNGDRIHGRIKSITDFGIFIGLPGGIDGLVYLSDISWNEPGETAVRRYSKGEELDSVILSIDPDRERISLGIKQLDQEPFNDYVAINDRNSIVTGVVASVDTKGAVITLAPDVEGRLKASEIMVDRVEDARSALSVGDEVNAKIIGVDRKNRAINLSIKARDQEDERQAHRQYREQETERPGPTTLGDLIKAQMRRSTEPE